MCKKAAGVMQGLNWEMRPEPLKVPHLNSRGIGVAAKLNGQRKAGPEHGQRAQLARKHKIKQAP